MVLKEGRGITLIALVITIVVILILAGITIGAVIDDNGIINKTENAKTQAVQDNEKEIINRAQMLARIRSKDGTISKESFEEALKEEAEPNETELDGDSSKVKVKFIESGNEYIVDLDSIGGGSTGGTTIDGGSTGNTTGDGESTGNTTIDGEEGNSNNPTIPDGYTPVDTDTSQWGDGDNPPSQDSVDHGLVIRDEEGNEWVWIPVPDVTVMCDTSNKTEYTLCGTSGNTAVKTRLYSKSEILKQYQRKTPGISEMYVQREPDLVVGNDNASYDADESNYKTILGFASKEKMAEAFVNDYKEMIASISKYGGFYIGRYELSEAGVKKNQQTLTNINWYNLYKKCKELKASDKVETGMVWGCQWDVTCKFIANKGDKKSITDSRSWGNYYDSIAPANTGNYEQDEPKNTGSNEAWKANNIYDLAGNYIEWSQEAVYNFNRISRGGGWYYGAEGNVECGFLHVPDSTGHSDPNIRYPSNFNDKVV